MSSLVKNEGAEFLVLNGVGLHLRETVAFENTNWTWRRGEQWALLGSNGSGKSLLIEALLGRVPLARGEIRGPRSDTDPTELNPEEAIAVVSPETQRELVVAESSFYQSRWHSGLDEGQRTVTQLLSQDSVEGINPFEVNPRRGNHREFLRRRQRFIRWLGIENLLRRKIAGLSNGELRKTVLVHALLRAPRLLVLDDPYAGLDSKSRTRLSGTIQRLMKMGWPVLMVTHRPEEIPALTTHVMLVDEHRVVAQGRKTNVLRYAIRHFGAATRNARASSRGSALRKKANSSAPLVELRRVTVTASRTRILSKVNWTICRGQNWAVFGPNGAGKTTLLNLIQGDHPQAHALDIYWFGKSADSPAALWQARQRISSMSPELHAHYPPEWPALDVVCSGYFNSIGLYEPCSKGQRRAAREWLQDFGLAAHERLPFGELSMGQQRLVLLARAVVKRPWLLLLDEPLQSLDGMHRHSLLAAVDRVAEQTGATLVFATHLRNELPHCITHVLQLKAGRTILCGKRRHVYPSPFVNFRLS